MGLVTWKDVGFIPSDGEFRASGSQGLIYIQKSKPWILGGQEPGLLGGAHASSL